jgi:hypothetical protein
MVLNVLTIVNGFLFGIFVQVSPLHAKEKPKNADRKFGFAGFLLVMLFAGDPSDFILTFTFAQYENFGTLKKNSGERARNFGHRFF